MCKQCFVSGARIPSQPAQVTRTFGTQTNVAFFISQSRLGKSFYELREHKLITSGKRGFKRFEIEFDLKDISPHLARTTMRPFVLTRIHLFIACVVALGISAFRFLPSILFAYVAICGAIIIGKSLWAAIGSLAPLEVIRFQSKSSGLMLFDIVKERAQAAECDQFVDVLRHLIASNSASMPNQLPDPTSPSVTPAAGAAGAPSVAADH
jgi:hypothetical protein